MKAVVCCFAGVVAATYHLLLLWPQRTWLTPGIVLLSVGGIVGMGVLPWRPVLGWILVLIGMAPALMLFLAMLAMLPYLGATWPEGLSHLKPLLPVPFLGWAAFGVSALRPYRSPADGGASGRRAGS